MFGVFLPDYYISDDALNRNALFWCGNREYKYYR